MISFYNIQIIYVIQTTTLCVCLTVLANHFLSYTRSLECGQFKIEKFKRVCMEDYYSSKFQFHVIELSKIETTKGNHYMEKARDEMIKMSRDESER